MRRALHRSLFAIGLPLLLQGAPAHADSVEEMFSVARARRQTNQLAEAASGFKTIGIEHPDHPLAESAMLEYFDVLAPGFSPPGYASLEEAVAVAPIFVEGICSRSKNKTGCEKLKTVHCSVLRVYAEKRIKDNPGASEADRAAMKDAGDIYFGIWKRYGGSASTKEACRMDEILYNAAHAYQGARDIDATLGTLETLVDPQNGLVGSVLSNRALFQLGQLHVMLAEYPEALVRFDRLASQAPKDERTEDALYNAMLLRLQLGLAKEAINNAERLLALYGTKRKAEATTMVLEVGKALVERGDHVHAKAWLDKSNAQVKQEGSFEQKLVAAGLLGRALDALGDQKGAAEQYRGVFASATSSGWLHSVETENDGSRYLGSAWAMHALDAVAEASIFLVRTEGADSRPIPVSKATKAMQEAIDLRTEPIEHAIARYAKPVTALRKPPSRWVVGMSAASAGLFIDMAEQIHRGIDAMKRAKATQADLLAVQEAVKAILSTTKESARNCLHHAVENQQWNEATKRCQRYLETYHPKEYRVIEEFSPGFRAPIESALLPLETPFAKP